MTHVLLNRLKFIVILRKGSGAHCIRFMTKEIAMERTRLPRMEMCRSRKKFRASKMATKMTSCRKYIMRWLIFWST